MSWLSGWTFRKAAPIAGGSEAAANYPVPVTVHYGAGTDAPGHVYLGTKGQADFADMRFTAADGITALPHWVESKTDGDQALVWVRVDAIPTAGASIFVYYGNADATSASDGEATFLWFDGFDGDTLDLDKWAVFQGGSSSYSVSNGELTLVAGAEAAYSALEAIGDQDLPGVVTRVALRMNSTGTNGTVRAGIKSTANGAGAKRCMGYPAGKIAMLNESIAWGSALGSFSIGARYVFELWHNGSTFYSRGPGENWDAWAITPTGQHISLMVHNPCSGSYGYVLQRPFIATEPSIGTAGAEEIANVPYLNASFTVAPLDPPAPLTVQFTDTSTASNTTVESWLWDFGDGATSSEQHPSHTFPDEGERTVTLTIAAELGTLTSVATLRIMPNDGIGRVIGGLLASAGPAIERGGLGRIVGSMIAVPPAVENYWDIPRQEDHPGRVLPGGLYADPDGNWWNRQLFEAEASGHDGTKLGGRINWISPDREMLGVSVPGRFIVLYDGASVVGEAYHLTQHKPWQAHEDHAGLEAETYKLTIISGWPSTPPRHVSCVRHPEGILIEWDPPADEGSGTIIEYRLFRGASPAAMTQIAVVDGAARHYFDAGAPEPAVYSVVAFNQVLESAAQPASEIVDPDTERLSLRDALSGASWAGLPYAGWMGVRAIRLAPAGTFVLRPRAVRPIVPTIFPADATVQALAWSSDREDIATVDAAGVVRAISPGRAVIYATATDGTEEYASVPVIVAPAFMTDDMREYLMTAGFERVFTRAMPDALDRSITLLQGAGTAPDLALELDRPVLRVLIVAPDLREAEETRKRVHDALHGAGPLDIGGVRYLALEALSSGEYVEKTRRGPRYVCTLTFMIEKERTLHIVSDPVRANEIVGRSP